MKHIIISRLNFTDRALLNKYLGITKKVLIPALKSQTQKNFTWALLTNPADADYLKKQLDFPFVPIYGAAAVLKYCVDHTYHIQTRHDCDDYMSPKYVAAIQHEYTLNSKKYNTFIVHTQPIKQMYQTGEEFPLSPYHETRCSMFLSLCQTTIKHHVFEKKHGSMFELADHVINLGEGYNKWIIHGNNISVIGRQPNQPNKDIFTS